MTDLEQRVNDVLTKLDIEIAEMRAAREKHDAEMHETFQKRNVDMRETFQKQNADTRKTFQKYKVYMYKAGEDVKTPKFLESLNRYARNFYISYTIFVTLAIIAIFLK